MLSRLLVLIFSAAGLAIMKDDGTVGQKIFLIEHVCIFIQEQSEVKVNIEGQMY